MGKKHKLIRMPEGDIKEASKVEMVDFIKSRFARGHDTKLQDIQDRFSQQPWELSEGSVINYLNELVEKRKISTWKTKTHRYYGPPKISLPIKIGIAVAVFIIASSLLIDNFCPPDIIGEYLYLGMKSTNPKPTSYMLPIVVYLIILDMFFTVVWWFSEHKKKKSI